MKGKNELFRISDFDDGAFHLSGTMDDSNFPLILEGGDDMQSTPVRLPADGPVKMAEDKQSILFFLLRHFKQMAFYSVFREEFFVFPVAVFQGTADFIRCSGAEEGAAESGEEPREGIPQQNAEQAVGIIRPVDSVSVGETDSADGEFMGRDFRESLVTGLSHIKFMVSFQEDDCAVVDSVSAPG